MGYGSAQIEDVIESMRKVCTVQADDGVILNSNEITAAKIREDAEYDGVRVKIPASLDKARTTLQIDIGFGDAVSPAAEIRELPAILELDAPVLRVYPPETAIAEKFQAMVHLDMTNTRMKDFYDVWLLCQEHQFEMSRLAGAIRATFERRNTEIPIGQPVALTDKFLKDKAKATLWREFLNRAGLSPSFAELHEIGELVMAFLMPVVEEIRDSGGDQSAWPAKGPWNPPKKT